MPQRCASRLIASRRSSTPPALMKAVRMKKRPVSWSLNWCASVMLPRHSAMRVATEAVIPGRSSQVSLRM